LGVNWRPVGAASFSLEEGFIRTSYIKSVEAVDSYDLDIESIYRRHSSEEMSLPVFCFRINFGCVLNDNEFLYFLAPQQIANNWTLELQRVVSVIREQEEYPDKRVIWLKKLYLQLYNECEKDCRYSEYNRVGPRPVEALQVFGGRVEKWRNLGINQNLTTSSKPTDSSSSTDGGSTNRLKKMTIAVTRRVKGKGSSSRSQSPQPYFSSLARPPSIKSQMSSQSGPISSPGFLLKVKDATAFSDLDVESLYTPRYLLTSAPIKVNSKLIKL
jgi:hypothetical protein